MFPSGIADEVFSASAIQDRSVLASIVGSFWVPLLITLPDRSVVRKPVLSGAFRAGLAGLADLLAAAFVFVVGSHVSDPGVQRLEFPGRPGGHLRAAVRDREQDRAVLVIDHRVGHDTPATHER